MLIKYETEIEKYIDRLLGSGIDTYENQKEKKELTEKWLKNYHDLVESGMENEVAYNAVISRINIEIKGTQELRQKEEQDKKRYARNVAIAVMMYILCPISVIVLDNVGNSILGVVIMFLLIAAASGLLIYTLITSPRYKKVDEFYINSSNDSSSAYLNKNYKSYQSVSNVLSPLILIVYLLVSFITGQWWITWIIFIIGAAIKRAIEAYFEMRDIKDEKRI